MDEVGKMDGNCHKIQEEEEEKKEFGERLDKLSGRNDCKKS